MNFQLSIFKRILLATVFLCLLLPVVASTALDPDYDYPELGEQTITTESSLPEIIRYFVTFTILIAALAAFAALVYSGIGYLTSTGIPEKMSKANSGIFSALLGLAILLGSYLVLVTVNPQLLIMRIERAPITSAILLLTEDGKDRFDRGGKGNEPADLVDDEEAVYLTFNIPDCEEEFGVLIDDTDENDEAIKVFEEFNLHALAFLGEEVANKYKVVVYANKEFSAPTTDDKQQYNQDGDITVDQSIVLKVWGDPPQPPLAIKKEGIGPGVYLYEYENGAAEPRDEEYFTPPGSNNFGTSNLAFNDKTTHLRIKNREKIEGSDKKTHDYIAVLSERENYPGANFVGRMQMFFEIEKRKFWVPDSGNPGQYIAETDTERGNVVSDAKTKADREFSEDLYGNVNKKTASAILIKELNNDPTVCKEVRICDRPELGGKKRGSCISYTPAGKPITDIPANIKLTLPLPLYVAQNVQIEGVDLNDAVESIYINGDCLVALFEHPVNPDKQDEPSDFWQKDHTGTDSEIFTATDYNLLDNGTATCEGWFRFNFGAGSCVSAIAVYPITSGY